MDRANLIGDILAIVCFAAFAIIGYTQIQRVGRDEGRRVADLRTACRRTSVRLAGDVNLNWIYYLSEVQLARGAHSARRIILARATADYQAAFVKAQSVDLRDAGLIKVRTPLGSGTVPQGWVINARFDCRRAYR